MVGRYWGVLYVHSNVKNVDIWLIILYLIHEIENDGEMKILKILKQWELIRYCSLIKNIFFDLVSSAMS